MPIKPYKFTAERRKAYLEALMSGMRRIKAAKAIGLDPKTIELYVNATPEFEEQRDKAEMIAIEEIEEKMYQVALEGNTTAGFRWLEAYKPEIWAKKQVLPGSSPEHPFYVSQGEIDWAALPDDICEEFLAVHAKILALQPGSGGLLAAPIDHPALGNGHHGSS